MSRTRFSTEPQRIADRLARAHAQRFIGRREELRQFAAALSASQPPFSVLHVHGPGGVGKTALLRELARMASAHDRRVVSLDGRELQHSSQALSRALQAPLDDTVVLIDTYEALAALDSSLREELLPGLPGSTLIVLAGRRAPALPWTTDTAWAGVTRVLKLDNFTHEEGIAFLRSRGVAASAHAKMLAFTHGHPLALALTADLLDWRAERWDFELREAPDIVRQLLSSFIETVPSGWQRTALDICALARRTTEPLLVDLLGAEQGRAAFDWLCQQPFVERGTRGLHPHDLVRDVLFADASWRDEEGLRALSRRIYAYLHGRAAKARGEERQRLQLEALYVTRTKSSNRGYFDWSALDEVRARPASAEDADWILGLVQRHEGAESAHIAARWWSAQPAAFRVFYGADDARFGFLALLELDAVGAVEVADPAVAAARAFVRRHSAPRRGDVTLYLRWWMHAQSYQAITAAINLTAMHVVSQCVTRSTVAWNFVAMADAAAWVAHFDGVNFPRVPEADFEVGGRRYGVFAHDWRIEPPANWLMGAFTPMPFARNASLDAGVATLSEAQFREAVRQALRDYTRPGSLADNPLQAAHMLRRCHDAAARAATIQRLLLEAAETLKANPRDRKLHRALWHTYFEPVATQEQAAERLALPFSTYRHHLGRGIERIAQSLWVLEQSSPQA